jgi:hypothetical protein
VGYLHIENLYKNQTVLIFKELWALEKVHGTSAHISWKNGKISFFSGGEKHDRFAAIFDIEALTAGFQKFGHQSIVIYGEAYGGSQQKQAWRYGDAVKFVVFDVQVGDVWLRVPDADNVVQKLGLEFVSYVKIDATVEACDIARDAPSVQAKRNGVEGDKPMEGVVLRPLIEFAKNNGDRIIAKHKRPEERETSTNRDAKVDPANFQVLADAEAIAIEWVTENRLDHVLQKLPQDIGIRQTGDVVRAMVEDVLREGRGEFVNSDQVHKAIGNRARILWFGRINQKGKQ